MTSTDTLNGSLIIDALRSASVQFVLSVPDIVTSDGLLWPLAEGEDPRLIRVCKEDEGLSMCAAMSYNSTRAVMLMQQTGLMDSLNAVRALGMDYELPLCMMVGLQGKDPNVRAAESTAYGVRIIEPVLDAMDISHTTLESDNDVGAIPKMIDHAYRESRPHCFLFGRPPLPPALPRSYTGATLDSTPEHLDEHLDKTNLGAKP